MECKHTLPVAQAQVTAVIALQVFFDGCVKDVHPKDVL